MPTTALLRPCNESCKHRARNHTLRGCLTEITTAPSARFCAAGPASQPNAIAVSQEQGEHLETASRCRPRKFGLRGKATQFKVSALTAVRFRPACGPL